MDLRRAIHELVTVCRTVGVRLHSNEQDKVSEVDLVMLRAQLFLLDADLANLQEVKRIQRKQDSSK